MQKNEGFYFLLVIYLSKVSLVCLFVQLLIQANLIFQTRSLSLIFTKKSSTKV